MKTIFIILIIIISSCNLSRADNLMPIFKHEKDIYTLKDNQLYKNDVLLYGENNFKMDNNNCISIDFSYIGDVYIKQSLVDEPARGDSYFIIKDDKIERIKTHNFVDMYWKNDNDEIYSHKCKIFYNIYKKLLIASKEKQKSCKYLYETDIEREQIFGALGLDYYIYDFNSLDEEYIFKMCSKDISIDSFCKNIY